MTAATIPKIGTHDGTFHCDEALACHMLRTLPAYATSPIVRTRDPALLSSLDIVVDVGGEYNPSNHRYDHHQRSFQTTFASEGARSSIKLSSAGLVYKHFGREVLRAVLSRHSIQVEEQDIDKLYLKVYDSFVQAVDAVDNGVSRFESDKPARYESSTDLSSRVSRLNADWWEKKPDQDANFLKAVVLTGTEFDDCIVSTAKSWLPARTIVATAMSQRTEHDSAGRLLVMTEWAPWKDHLYNIENEQGQPGSVMYVIYQDMTRISWRVQCVPVEKDSFKSRRPLPEPWRGFRDAELDNLTGIDGCVFVHAAGFIGGNKTFEGALQMAHKALEGES
eukprot:GFKZ01015857.1.p1 GENE.GFKZ01015857.1~~GFKZ01015857.1.p1  ORF type:complete len:373 (-),score=40.90 GFKZ01015857.1:1970-2974(-)